MILFTKYFVFFFMSVSIFMFVFFLIQYIIIRKREYLCYSIYLLCLFIYYLVALPDIFFKVPLSDLGRVAPYDLFKRPFQFLSSVFYTAFILYYLGLEKIDGYLFKFFKTLICVYIFLAILCFGLNYERINYDMSYYILSLTLFPLQLFVVIALFRHKVRYANYIIWGSIITLVGSSFTLTYYIYLKAHEPTNPYANAYSYLPVIVSILFDMFLFTIALQKKIADNEKSLILAATSRQQAIILERERIIADLHDDVGGGLSSIRMMSDLMSQQGERESLHSYVFFGNKISLTAKDIAQRMHTIIWSLNAENDTVINFAEYVRQYGVSFFENSPIKFTSHNVSSLPNNVQISGVKRKNLFLIVKEAFHNILKHSHGSVASVEIFMIGNILFLNISDNGNGLPTEKNTNAVKFGNGLKNMHKRMDEIHGTISFQGDDGTVIKIKLTITESLPEIFLPPHGIK